MNNLKIGHYADIQAKVRSKNLRNNFFRSLKSIIQIVTINELDVVVIAGDIFEYDEPNEDERELIYQHIIDLLKIEKLKELVVMLGNHDYDASGNTQNNPISILQSILSEVDDGNILKSKLNYLKESKQTPSIINENLVWLPYSLEDNSTSHKLLYRDILFNDENKMYIGVFHDILFEYVEDKGLPVRNKKRLFKRSDFLCDYIFAGDIHEKWSIDGFYYPGSTLQRNHGEGSYLKFIGRENIRAKQAPHKYILVHDVDVQNKKVLLTKPIKINNNLDYLTIDLSTTKPVELNFIESEILNFIKNFNDNDIIVKIKLSSEQQKHRSQILSICSSFSKFEIEIQDIKSIVHNNNIDLKNGKLESYVLSQEKIVSLFELGLATVDDNTSIFKEVKDDVINLFRGNLELIYDAEKSYDIELLNIETNGFQILGNNKINLDIPGLTRISATNKVGKTTFYLMFNFIRYGKIYSQLKDNNKRYNNSLIFNNKLPDVNHVNVTLNTKINGMLVKIQRNVYRKWKDSSTEKQRLNKNHLEYLSSIKQTLKIEIFDNETNEVKHTIENDKAEILLNRWFGESIKNLLIINQFKLENLLNLPTDKLENLLLEYIGNNFIETMVESLPSVKENMLSDKPKKTDIVLNAEIIEHENNLILAEESNKKIKEELKTIENENLQYVGAIKKLNDKLTELGNVPNKILNLQTEIDKLTSIIDNHTNEEYHKVPEPLNLIEPKHVDNNETVHKLKVDISTKEKDVLTINNENNSIINGLLNAFLGAKNKQETKITEIIKSKIESLHKEKDELTLVYNDHAYWVGLKKLISVVDEKMVEINNKKSTINATLTTNDNTISKLQLQLKTGVCAACNQKIAGKDIDVDKINVEIDQLKVDNKNLNDDVKTLTVEYDELKTEKVKLQKIYDDKTIDKTIDINIDIVDDITVLINKIDSIAVENRKLSVGTLKSNGELLCNDEYTKFVEIQDYYNSLLKFKDDGNINNINEKILPHLSKHQNNITILTEINDNIGVLNDEIERLETVEKTYNQELKDYNTKNAEYLKSVADVNNKNIEITQRNQKYNDAILLVKQPKIDIEKLKTVDLENFKKLNSKLIEIDNLHKDNNNLIQTKNKSIYVNDNTIVNTKDLILECKEEIKLFQKWNDKKLTFKYYHLMITKVLSKSIFNYYRNSINYKFNELLENVNFDLEWNEDGKLYKIEYDNDNSTKTYTNVIGASGMETCFLGLSLIYSISELNQKHKLSHIFIDEISGQLNSGKDASDGQTKTNYQEMLILLLSKFEKSKIFIVDHVIKNLFETETYVINKQGKQSFMKLK